MPNFHATVRIFDIDGPDKLSAERSVEETLRNAGVGRWQVLSVLPEAPPLPVSKPRPAQPAFPQSLGPILLLGAVAWALWFYWQLIG